MRHDKLQFSSGKSFPSTTSTSTSGRQTDSDTHKSIFGDSFIANISSDIELDDGLEHVMHGRVQFMEAMK